MKREILIISYFFYPENNPRAFRTFELAKELAKKNKVKIIIPKKNIEYYNLEQKYNFDIVQIESGVFFNKNYIRNKIPESSKSNRVKSLLKKIYNYLFSDRTLEYFYPLMKELKKINYKYDAVISIGLPFSCHLGTWLGVKFNKNLTSKIILDYGDPFYKNKTCNMAPYFKKIEKIVLKYADDVVIPIEKMKDSFKEYDIENKIKIIPQGFSFENIKLEKYIKNKISTFIYAGLFYEEIRNPLNFFKELNKLKIEYKFYIYTDINHLRKMRSGAEIEKEIRKSNNKMVLNNIIPREKCIVEMSKADFLINLENINSEQSPSKLIDYAISKRPILSFNQENFDIFIFKEFLNGNYTMAKTINLEEYDIKKISKQFMNLIVGEM